MVAVNSLHHAFNRGEVGVTALARVDVARMRLSAIDQINWLPLKLGPMMLRPGTQYVGGILGNQVNRIIPFIFSATDTSILEFTPAVMRVWTANDGSDEALIARASVSTAVVNGDFAAMISNGDFASDTAWTKGTGWTIAAGVASSDGSQSADADLSQTATGLVTGSSFSVTFTVSGFSAGTITPVVGGTAGTARSANGTYTETIVCGAGTTLALRADADFVGNVDNVTISGWVPVTSGSGAAVTASGGMISLSSPASGGVSRAKNTMSVALADRNIEHAFRIIVDRGPVTFRCGSTDGDDDLISETSLDTGTHSLAFTPTTALVYIQIETTTARAKLVDSITIEAAGTMTIPTPWGESDLANLRCAQSGDIVYVACNGYQQRKLERRTIRSWSIVLYKPDDGPFGIPNTSDLTLTPAAFSGNTTLTASRSLFKSAHVGALFRLFSSGQSVASSLAAENTFSDAVRVSGVGTSRAINYAIAGTWSGTITLQRSFESEVAGFSDFTTFTTNTAVSGSDGLDNSIIWYRLGFKTGDYSSGTAEITLDFPGGGGAGIARVTSVASSTVASVEVLDSFSSLVATSNWIESDWSPRKGWPSAGLIHDGRLWWAGRDRLWGSISDSYESFNYDDDGATATINRSLGEGPIDRINWLLPLTRLIVGRQGAETSIRSSNFDEPLTPTNFTLKDCSTQGSAIVDAVKMDKRGIFVQRSKRKLYQLLFSVESQDYDANDLNSVNPDIGSSNFMRVAVQRQPDSRIHVIREDGVIASLVLEPDEDVMAWWRIVTAGNFEDMAVLPGEVEDRVYVSVKRTVNGSTVRYFEKFARQEHCVGGSINRIADSHVVYSGSATTTIPAAHLEGETVVVWANGVNLGTKTVSGGAVTLASAATPVVVGLGYDARFRSAKLAYGAQLGTAINQTKEIKRLGLVMFNTHYQGVQYGQDYDHMSDLPLVENGTETAADTIWGEYDQSSMPLDGTWTTDSRLCLTASAPLPAMVGSAVITVQTHERI